MEFSYVTFFFNINSSSMSYVLYSQSSLHNGKGFPKLPVVKQEPLKDIYVHINRFGSGQSASCSVVLFRECI